MPISQHGETPESAVVALPSDGTARSEEGIAESGITFRLWRLYQRFWLLCLLFPLFALVREPHAPWHLVLGLFSLLFFAASYTWLTWPHPVNQRRQAQTRSRLSLLLLVVLSLQVTAFSLLDGPAWLWLFIGVSAIAGVLLPMRAAGIVVVLFTAKEKQRLFRRKNHDPSAVSGRPGDGAWSALGAAQPRKGYRSRCGSGARR